MRRAAVLALAVLPRAALAQQQPTPQPARPQAEPPQRAAVPARPRVPDGPATEPSSLPFETWVTPERPAAVLQALDKVTGRVRTIEAAVGGSVTFLTLTIAVRACRRHPPEEVPENAAFLEISDRRGAAPRTVFSGWMFSSSPAISALEHPVYDIWVTECRSLAAQ